MGFYPFTVAAGQGTGLLLPSGDASGATDTARINAAMASGQRLAIGNFTVNAELKLDTGWLLAGSGYGTVITPTAAVTGYGIGLKNPATSGQVTVRDLTFNCNQVSAGLLLDNTGYAPIAQFVLFDPLHNVENVMILASAGDAFHFDNNARGIHISGCRSYFAAGYNFYGGAGAGGFGGASGLTDGVLVGNISGPSANEGIALVPGSSDNMLIGNKVFYSGYNEATQEFGTTESCFDIQSQWNTLVGNNGQQGALHGATVTGANNALVGNNFDTNSAGTAGGVGINIDGSLQSAIGLNVGSNNSGLSPGAQEFGYQVAGDNSGTAAYGNTVQGTGGAFNYVSGFGTSVIDPSIVGLNDATLLQAAAITYAEDSSVQALTNGATIVNGLASAGGNFAVYPVSSTAAVTGLILEAPLNGAATAITVVNTTAFTLTFAAAATSHVADGVADVIPALTSRTFTYDASTTLWYRAA